MQKNVIGFAVISHGECSKKWGMQQYLSGNAEINNWKCSDKSREIHELIMGIASNRLLKIQH